MSVRMTNPFSGVLSNLAGTSVELTGKGFGFNPNAPNNLFAEPVFERETGSAAIADFLNNPIQTGQLFDQGQAFASLFPATAARTLGMSPDIFDSITQGVNTGFRTDIQPILDQQLALFNDQVIPDIAERFAGTSGISSSDFGRATSSAARQLALDLGSQQVALDEAAANRRQAMTQAAPQLSAVLGATPLVFGDQAARLDEYFRNTQESTRPGARMMDFLLQASGIQQGTSFQPGDTGPPTAIAATNFALDPVGFGGGGAAAFGS